MLLKEALAAKISVTENGKQRNNAKLEVLIKQLVNKAAGGDLRAIEIVLRMNRDLEASVQRQEQSRPLP